MKIIAFDPGNSTGWVMHDTVTNKTYGGTIKENFLEFEMLFDDFKPDVVIYETFALYPGVAKSLSWNKFYPSQVIGVLEFLAQKRTLPISEQSPSVKKFAGKVDFRDIIGDNVTVHTKDAYLHLAYHLRTKKID